jgi:hypothetical protein
MIKNIAYFPSQCALNSRPVMSAVLDCLQASGIETQENSMTSDAAVIWSVLWNGRMGLNKPVYEHYRSLNKPVIVLDVGALIRGRTWKLAVNHISAAGFYGHTDNLDRARPFKLGISLGTLLSDNGKILIAAQHNRSLQLATLPSMESWITEKVNEIRNYSDREIVIRPHPRCTLNQRALPSNVTVETPKKITDTYDNFDINYCYHTVVNYNSGPGIQAALAGARVIVDRSSLAYPVSITAADIEKPNDIDRCDWLVEITHTEYTVDELRRGQWLTRIEPALTVHA